jgi:hypothetical protein
MEPKLAQTKDYRMFTRCVDNRPMCPKKHKRLRKAMEMYGFLPCFPIAVVKDKSGRLVVYDGQHRLAIAETLSLAVYYVIIDEGFDIALVNCTQEKWNTRNFAETYAAQGKHQYALGLDFADDYGLPVGTAFGLLAGTGSWNNIATEYYTGDFEATDIEYAEKVGHIYSELIKMAPRIRNGRLLEACIACGRVHNFDPQRLIAGAARCRERLVSYGTRDAFLDMLEDVYNFGRKQLMPLKIAAIQVMRERNAASASGAKAN